LKARADLAAARHRAAISFATDKQIGFAQSARRGDSFAHRKAKHYAMSAQFERITAAARKRTMDAQHAIEETATVACDVAYVLRWSASGTVTNFTGYRLMRSMLRASTSKVAKWLKSVG
jgi:hypothetical protein